MLTKRQADALRFIVEYLRDRGFSPSHQEITAHLGCVSKSAATRVVRQLQDRGYIRHLKRRARAIEVLRPLPFRAVADFIPVATGPSGDAFLDLDNRQAITIPVRR